MRNLLTSVILLAVLGCEGGRTRVDCEDPEPLGVLEFKGEAGAAAMRSFCHGRTGGVATWVIVEATSATRLDLPCICAIDHHLIVKDNPGLVELTGLENVRSIGGPLSVLGNPELRTLAGLPEVESLGEYDGTSIQIEDNDALLDLNGLPPALTTLPGSIEIAKNDRLTSLQGLPQGLLEAGGLTICGNPSLRDLTGISTVLKRLTGGLAICDNDSLRDLTGLPDTLERIEGEVSIFGNASLEHLQGAPSELRYVGTSLRITANNSLIDLTGLPANLEVKWNVTISSNGRLTNLAGLPAGLRIGKDETGGLSLLIQRNDGLTDLSGLPETVTALPGGIVLRGTPVSSMQGLFEHLRTIGGGLELDDNDALRDLSGIPEGTVIGKDLAGPSLLIQGNDGLASLAGLPLSMRVLVGGLSIVNNKGLKNLAGLETLESVGGHLLIGKRARVNLIDPCVWDLAPGGNADLQSLAGLDALSSVGGVFAVACHPELATIESLGTLRSVGSDLFILHNPELAVLADLGGPSGSLESVGGTFAVYCSAKLDPGAVTAVLSKVEENVTTDILLDCG